jgi:pimeloyl-ACP methyl ester carboxylesterase
VSTQTLQQCAIFFPAYLATGNFNIIGVDWGVLAASPNYAAAAANTRVTGAHVGELIQFLVAQTGARLEDFHLIGHSLGAHTSGFAGKSITRGRVGRITGLYCSVEEASVGLNPLPSVYYMLASLLA